MFIILEWNGNLPEGFIGAVLYRDGEIMTWKTQVEVEKWAKRNCAFNYKIVELT